MLARTIPFVITALLATASFGPALGQEGMDRVLHFRYADTVEGLQEIATVIKAMTEVSESMMDLPQRELKLRGTPAQLAFAEWLLAELDKPAGRPSGPDSSQHEYRLPGAGDEALRIFYVSHTATPEDLQEVATMVRSMGDIRRLFTCNATSAITLRGTPDQIALAEWLVNALDSQSQAAREFTMPGNNDDVARVFFLTPEESPKRLQEVAAKVRTELGVPRLFIYNGQRALALRGTPPQIAQADRVIQERAK
ncbi:MAG: hypothetical protein ABIZ80_22060 [Bryobacteraceae bacterium]